MNYNDFKTRLEDLGGIENVEIADFPEISKNEFEKKLNRYNNEILKKEMAHEKIKERENKRTEKEAEKAKKEAEKEARREFYNGYLCNSDGYPIDILENYCVYISRLEDTTLTTNCISKKRYINKQELDETVYLEITRNMNRDLRIGRIKDVARAVNALALTSLVNPIADCIRAGVWDGKERVKTFFIDFLGADDTELTRILTFKWFYGTVKRLFEPGCKMDPMIIFVDPQQGTGKTNIMQRLGNCFHTDNNDYVYIQSGNITLKPDDLRILSSTWITVFDEMASMNKADNSLVKSFVSHTTDTFRKPYDIDPKTYGRTCSFCGNSNSRFFLKDYTSNGCERRFWILPCNGVVRTSEEWKKILPDEYLQQVLYEVYDFYVKNPTFEYNTLSLDELNELSQLQKDYKTSIDDLATERLNEILHRKYPIDVTKDIPSSTIIDWLKDTYDGNYIGGIQEIKVGTLRLVLNADKNGGMRGNEWIESIIGTNFSDEFEIITNDSKKGRPLKILKRINYDDTTNFATES